MSDTGDKHIIEAMGKTEVIVQGGEVIEVGTPLIEYCPLFNKYRGIQKISSDVVRENIEFRIRDFGMCTPKRRMRMRDFLSFGVSELMAMCVRQGMVDCVVTVCDGAGTVIITDPELIQGVGGRISGVVSTSPITQIIDELGKDRVLDPERASIDQFRGVESARAMGFERVGVTVTDPEDSRRIRERFGDSVIIFAVHLTGVPQQGAMVLFSSSDIVTGCASSAVRDIGDQRAKAKVGNKIPIYASSETGKEILERRLNEIQKNGDSRKKSEGEEDSPRPLV